MVSLHLVVSVSHACPLVGLAMLIHRWVVEGVLIALGGHGSLGLGSQDLFPVRGALDLGGLPAVLVICYVAMNLGIHVAGVVEELVLLGAAILDVLIGHVWMQGEVEMLTMR